MEEVVLPLVAGQAIGIVQQTVFRLKVKLIFICIFHILALSFGLRFHLIYTDIIA